MTNFSKLKVIAHRGLLDGPSSDKENNLENIQSNIKKYPEIINELDIWIDSNNIYIGHDYPKNKIQSKILYENSRNLILHIKGVNLVTQNGVKIFNNILKNCHYFAHQEDDFVITNKGWIWSHPRNGFVKNTICVLPEKIESLDSAVKKIEFNSLYGVCTDYPLKVLDLFH